MWKRIRTKQILYSTLVIVFIIVAGFVAYQVSKYTQAKHVLQICNVENMQKAIEKIETTKLDMVLVTKDMSYIQIPNDEIIQYIVEARTCQIPGIIKCVHKYYDNDGRLACIEAYLSGLED